MKTSTTKLANDFTLFSNNIIRDCLISIATTFNHHEHEEGTMVTKK
jgi:hypothetical protein